jgi:Carboxypeptidase regulatory-like domain
VRALSRIAGALAWVVLLPAVVHAQGSITGVVKDPSGAVLPGVTVEAASPALIERVRFAVTDGTGQYRIVDLRPGTYSLTCTLTGFNRFKRDGIELNGSFTATINAEMKVGAIEETVTVIAESPIVDTQSVRRQTTVAGDVLALVPTARSWYATVLLIPAIASQNGNSSDVQVTPQMIVFGGSGGRGNEGRMQVDGLNTGASLNGGGVSTYIADIGNAQEIALTTSGGLGEAEVGGPSISIVPKTGGNTIKGTIYFGGVGGSMIGSNYTDALRTAGLSTPGKLLKQWDANVGIGGPIKKDRLWFFATARDEGQYRSIPGIYPNLNAGDTTKWLYAPDVSRQAQGAESWQIGTVRLTYQATPRNKFNVFWDEQIPCNGATYSRGIDGCRKQPDSGAFIGSLGLGGLTTTSSPETAGYLNAYQRAQQVTWTSTVTSRLLLEAGLGTYLSRWGPFDMPGNPTRSLVRVTEQCGTGCPNNGNIPNLAYRSANWRNNWNGTHTWRAAMSFVTGAHAMKFGYMAGYLVDDQKNFTNDSNLAFRFGNGVPNQITETALPYQAHQDVRYDALYAQEQWTQGRMTLQGALRFDHAWSYFPQQQIGPSNYLPFPTLFPVQDGITGYKDITPRLGLAYDVFGDGRTALKVNMGKYLEPASNAGNYIIANPIARVAGGLGQPALTRNWTDANGNFVPDCDLLNTASQDLRASGGDSCGTLSNTNFGQPVFSNNIDPAILGGWGIRPSDWGLGVSVQQQLLPRVSVEVGYFRRWLNNFTVTDNVNVKASDFSAFTMTAPSDPRLPDGGGYPVSGLYDVSPALFGSVSNLITDASNYGNQYSHYNGLLINISARPRPGLTFQGGLNTGKTVQDICEVRAQVPELTFTAAGIQPAISPTNPYCRSDPGLITRFTGLGSYVIPKVDVLFSGTFRSDQGGVLAANYVMSNAEASRYLGRPLSSGANGNVTVNLVAPGLTWGDRVNELDVRLAKILRHGRTRTSVGIDVYNALNSNAILTYNQAFVPNGTWLAPTSVLTPRFAKFSTTFEF